MAQSDHTSILRRLLNYFYLGMSLFSVVVAISIAASSLLEVNGRVRMAADLDEQISAVEKSIADLTASEQRGETLTGDNVKARLEYLNKKRFHFVGIRNQLKMSDFSGNPRSFKAARTLYIGGATYDYDVGTDTLDLQSENYRGSEEMPFINRIFSSNVFDSSEYSTDSLMVFLTCSTCALGAIAAGLRSQQTTSIRDIALGLASGFVLLVAIKGGRFILFTSSTPNMPALNHFGIAFASALVGLFVDRAYSFLGKLIDRLESVWLAPAKPNAGALDAPPRQGSGASVAGS